MSYGPRYSNACSTARQRLWFGRCGASMTAMPLEVQTAGMPAAPHRALIFGVVLLALTCALAGSMVRSASRKVLGLRDLGLRVAPPGWAISFQPPRGFEPGETTDAGATSVRGFVGATPDGAEVTLTVRHLGIAPPHVDSETVARSVAGSFAAWRRGYSKRPGHSQQVPSIGTLEAVEIFNEQITTVVRAVVFPDRRALALSLSVHGGASLDVQLYRLFDLTCRSVVCE